MQIRTVLGAAIGMGCGFAALFFGTLGVFLKPIAAEFAWSRAQTSGAVVLSMLGMGVGAVLVGRLLDRWGPARTIATGALLMTALVALMSRIPNHPGLLAALCFCIGLVGVATTPLGYLSVLPGLFDRRLGLAFGLSMAGLGLGIALTPVIAQRLVEAQGWREAYVWLALLALAGAAMAWLLMFVGTSKHAAKSASSSGRVPDGDTLGRAMRQGRFWILVVVMFLVAAAGLGAMVHTVALLTDRGLTGEAAARVAGMAALGVMLGRLAGGGLMDVLRANYVAAGSFALGGIGLWLLGSDTSNALALLTCAGFLMSFAIGTEGDLIPFSVRRYFGLRSFGSIFGVLFGVYAVGGVLGPFLFGFSFDRTGTYRPMLYIGAGACGAAAILSLLLGRYRFGTDR